VGAAAGKDRLIIFRGANCFGPRFPGSPRVFAHASPWKAFVGAYLAAYAHRENPLSARAIQ
jgi:hypothetical protein